MTTSMTTDISNPQIVSLDWVSFSVILALTEEERTRGHAILHTPEGITLIECAHGTPQYRRRVIVQSVGGKKILTLLLEPYAHIIDAASMFVEVANGMLYTTGGLTWLLPLLDQIHPYAWRSLSRYDVACDFNPTPHQQGVIEGLHNTSLYAQGKREGAMFYDYHLPLGGGRQTRHPRQLAWGSKHSAVKWKLYNKTLEVYETDDMGRRWANKPYIVDTWRAGGLDPDRVWRLECSLTGASTHDWQGEKMGLQMLDRMLGEWWYYDMVATRFTIRANEGHADRSNDTPVPLLNVPDGEAVRMRKRIGGESVRHVEYAATLRACIKELERPEVAYNTAMRATWIRTTEEVLAQGHLHEYFYRTFGTTWHEYVATIGSEAPM